MGTGTLALPYASERGGLAFNAFGLFAIGAWDYHIPVGLTVLDALMLSLFIGLVVAYEAAMSSFVSGTSLTTGSSGLDLLLPNTIVIALSCAPDVGWLGNFSGIGLLALAMSFVIISWRGFAENGFVGFSDSPWSSLGLWPESISDASSWFGVAVFSYGVAPFVFNFRDSMNDPRCVGSAVRTGLLLVYVGYIIMSNGIRILFSPSHVFDGDVLQAMPNSGISMYVRLLMTFVVVLTTPLVVVPCGELIEGKLGMVDADDSGDGGGGGQRQRRRSLAPKRILVRVVICLSCIAFSVNVPNGFVNLVSFIGCFCGATTGFVLPPLFRLKLSTGGKCWPECLCDVGALVLAVVATSITSALTFRELIGKVAR
ncbi:hypothetical protein ACHAXA_009712 [Cyclostephanos tholiformis]|uniref:Amino acid transporter transmembrane domain-containing protein n=1 Tax=Cyclostephanos tholiformis TaxID=382380 RepID=A0ABD3RV45_9STRA